MHPGVVLAIVIVGAIIVALVVPRARGVPVGGEVMVRCRQGHLFTTLWVPLASIKAVRLGWARFQRCPVGSHWSLVMPVNPTTLTADEIAIAGQVHDVRVP